MKFLKSLILLCCIVASSCSTDTLDEIPQASKVESSEPEEESTQEPESADASFSVGIIAALRMSLEQVKENDKQGSEAENPENSLCFQFVYPITVFYNDESSEEISSYDQLLQTLLDETSAKHLTDISYPFQVVKADEQIETINTAEDFEALVANCGYDEIDYNYVVSEVSSCFSIEYPLNLMINEELMTFDNQQEVQDYFTTNWTSSADVDLSYPIQVLLTSDGSQSTIEDDFEMIQLIVDTCGIE